MTIAWNHDAKPRRDEEGQLQAAIVQHLRLLASPDCIYYAIPNGEHRSKRTGARLKAQGVLKGAPDLAFVLPNGQPAYIELKRPGGRLSPEQKAFMEKCQRLRINHAVIADIDSALAILRGWQILPA